MYLVKVEVRESPIDGKGVFTLEDIQEGSVVWKFNAGHDKTLTKDEFEACSEIVKEELRRIAYLSKNTELWVFPPEGDPARYTNHSKTNNLSVLLNTDVSVEPLFFANRNIMAGEELTNNYTEFDNLTVKVEQEWLK